MNALEILAAVNTKVVGAYVDGQPLPVIGMRPAHTVFDLRGDLPHPRTPLEAGLADTGFTLLAAGDPVPDPHPDWIVTLPTPTSYKAAYQGEVQISSNLPTPHLWGQLVRQVGWALLLFQREAGPEVSGQELLTEMTAGSCFAVNARLV